jgi:hypothetical protein
LKGDIAGFASFILPTMLYTHLINFGGASECEKSYSDELSKMSPITTDTLRKSQTAQLSWVSTQS